MTGRGLLTWAALVGGAALLLGCGRPAEARAPVPEGLPCAHGQLTGLLAHWTAAPDGGLAGDVDLTNLSTVDCTVRGAVEARLYAGGEQLPIGHTTTPGETGIPAGTHATLRVHWSGPYCRRDAAPYELLLALPDGGGVLRAPVLPDTQPACGGPGGSVLAVEGFAPPVQAGDLTMAVTGSDTVQPGERVVYHVALSNLTGGPVTFTRCPTYTQRVGDGPAETYRLDCRTVRGIEAGHTVRYEMVCLVPAAARPGDHLVVRWGLAGEPGRSNQMVLNVG